MNKQEIEALLELSRVLLIASVSGILSECGNSYACSYTENWLRQAKELGAYSGECVGKIKDLQKAWEIHLEADNMNFPDIPRHISHT